MEDIDFKQLKRLWTLKLVVDTGSIKKAALRANVTSSAVSQAVTGLEQILSRKLLLRKKGQILPTEYGSQLLHSCEPAFSVCFNLNKNISGTCAVVPKIAWLDFATTESLALDVLPGIMRSLRAQFPEIRLKVKSGRSGPLTSLVKKAELCMALVEENDSLDGVHKVELAEERLGFYTSAEMAKLHRDKVFDKLGVGIFSAGSEGHPSYFSKFVRILGKNFKPTLTTESYELLRETAIEGHVIAVLPSRVARRSARQLVEVFPPAMSASQSKLGRYKIYLVSEPGCSPEENLFLAQELKTLISASSIV